MSNKNPVMQDSALVNESAVLENEAKAVNNKS